MELQEQLTFYRGILLQKLSRVQEKEEIVEIMLLLAVGMLSLICLQSVGASLPMKERKSGAVIHFDSEPSLVLLAILL